jgi:hypothetical protein
MNAVLGHVLRFLCSTGGRLRNLSIAHETLLRVGDDGLDHLLRPPQSHSEELATTVEPHWFGKLHVSQQDGVTNERVAAVARCKHLCHVDWSVPCQLEEFSTNGQVNGLQLVWLLRLPLLRRLQLRVFHIERHSGQWHVKGPVACDFPLDAFTHLHELHLNLWATEVDVKSMTYFKPQLTFEHLHCCRKLRRFKLEHVQAASKDILPMKVKQLAEIIMANNASTLEEVCIGEGIDMQWEGEEAAVGASGDAAAAASSYLLAASSRWSAVSQCRLLRVFHLSLPNDATVLPALCAELAQLPAFLSLELQLPKKFKLPGAAMLAAVQRSSSWCSIHLRIHIHCALAVLALKKEPLSLAKQFPLADAKLEEATMRRFAIMARKAWKRNHFRIGTDAGGKLEWQLQ